jgi:heat shock protein HtpX
MFGRFAFARRMLLFVLTNLAVVFLLAVVFQVLGLESLLAAKGLRGDLGFLLVFSAAFGFLGSFISLALSKPMAKWATKAQVITQPRNQAEAWLLATVRRQAQQAGIQPPEVAVYPASEPNAFATGMRRDAALVAVSTGLLEAMDERELRAVLAHEIAHVANGDMVTMALLQGVLNTFVIFFSRVIGLVVDRVVFRTERGYGIGYWLVTIFAQIVLGLLASIIVMAYSRRREFRADAGAASIEGAGSMVAALEALRRQHQPAQLDKSLAAFGIRGPRAGGLRRLFASHPPIEERIAALQGNAAGGSLDRRPG